MINAQQLIEKTCQKYAECKSYSDTGVASTDNDAAIRDLRFKTSFVRDDKYRFECRQYHPHLGKSGPDVVSVAWSNGTRHSFCASSSGEKDFGEFSGTIGAATGVSRGSVILIASLLMPDQVGIRSWLALEGARILREETVDKHNCLVLGGFRRITEYSAWIDKDDFSIRKIVQIMRLAKHTTDEMELADFSTSISYSNITFNQPIESKDLEPNFPVD